jgi:Flp pilus assembly protein TadG
MSYFRDENGQVLVTTAACMVILLSFLGFAAEVGTLFWVKRNAQDAADAAATAGALDYEYNISVSSAQAAAQAAATANGFTNGSNGVTVTVNVPPASGPNQTLGYVEAIIQQTKPMFFVSLLGPKTMTVAARAVAGVSPPAACLNVLGGSGITGSGTGSLSMPNCAIDDDGGITLSGSLSITAAVINLVGSETIGAGETVSPAPTKSSTMSDPLASLTQPTVPGSCSTLIAPFPNPLPVGCYANLISSGTATLNLQSGLYVIEGIIASGSLNITGTGVTIYMPSGGITGSGNIGLNITAPTSGPYDGMALWLSRTNSSGITLSGSSTTSFQGIIYAPDSNLTFSGTTPMSLTADAIVNNITFSGSTTISNYLSVNGSTTLGGGGGTGAFAMVE